MKEKIFNILKSIAEFVIPCALIFGICIIVDSCSNKTVDKEKTYDEIIKNCERILEDYIDYREDQTCTFENDDKFKKYFKCKKDLYDKNEIKNIKSFCKETIENYGEYFD